MPHHSTPSRPGSVRCSSCLSPKVVAIDAIGSPMCLRDRALELGGREAQQELVLELLEQYLIYVIEMGMIHPDDVAESVDEAIRVASDNRPAVSGSRVPPTVADTQRELQALAEYDRLDEPAVAAG